MDSLAKYKLAPIAIVLMLLPRGGAKPSAAAGQDLHAQSAAALLEREFGDPDLSYLLLDEDGQIVAQRWEQPDRDIPVGSLMKPFFAVAYGRTHRDSPVFRCTGGKTCWLPRGHGTLHLREAVAFSCNSYFHQLVARAGRNFSQELDAIGLHGKVISGGTLSLTNAAPLALARAYLELTRHAREPAVTPVLQGMALAAQKGTAKAVAAELHATAALAKTGTAPCTHKKKAPGDGFAVVITPADHPRSVLLVRLHGRPGFIAASLAGRMIARVEDNGVAAR